MRQQHHGRPQPLQLHAEFLSPAVVIAAEATAAAFCGGTGDFVSCAAAAAAAPSSPSCLPRAASPGRGAAVDGRLERLGHQLQPRPHALLHARMVGGRGSGKWEEEEGKRGGARRSETNKGSEGQGARRRQKNSRTAETIKNYHNNNNNQPTATHPRTAAAPDTQHRRYLEARQEPCFPANANEGPHRDEELSHDAEYPGSDISRQVVGLPGLSHARRKSSLAGGAEGEFETVSLPWGDRGGETDGMPGSAAVWGFCGSPVGVVAAAGSNRTRGARSKQRVSASPEH